MTDRYWQTFKWEAGLRDTVSPSKGIVLAANSSADTKGAYAEILTILENDSQGLYIKFSHEDTGSTFLVDIAIGAVSSETIIINNLFIQTFSSPFLGECVVFLPIAITNGSRISARCQSSTGSDEIRISINSAQAKGSSVGFGTCETIGADTANSKGTQIDAGGVANTKGSYSQISASIGGDYKYVAIAVQADGDFLISEDCRHLIDIASGAAAAEVVLFGDFVYANDASGHHANTKAIIGIPLKIASGSRIAMRSQSNSIAADSRLIDAVVYGFY